MKDIQYKIGNPYNAHSHYDAHKALIRRLTYITNKITDEPKQERLNFIKAERQAIHYALECMEFIKISTLNQKDNDG